MPNVENDAPECNCESMGGRFGAHRPECPWQVAFEAQLSAENDAWDCDHHPEWADRRNVCHHPDHKTRCCPKCNGTDLRMTARNRLVCRDCEKRHKRERKDRRHRERGDRCGCGTDAVSLNPAEVVVHNWGGGACHIIPVTRPIPPGRALMDGPICQCGLRLGGHEGTAREWHAQHLAEHVIPPAESAPNA